VEKMMRKREKDEITEEIDYSDWKRWFAYFARKKVVNSMNLELPCLCDRWL